MVLMGPPTKGYFKRPIGNSFSNLRVPPEDFHFLGVAFRELIICVT